MNQEALRGNNLHILQTLQASKKPLGAYDIIKCKKIRNPPTVYRALEKLTNLGLVCRLASLNAFVAYKNNASDVIGFTICRLCHQVEEIHNAELGVAIKRAINNCHFRAEREILELVGLCHHCYYSHSTEVA